MIHVYAYGWFSVRVVVSVFHSFFLLAQGQWVGWGGMLTFLELAHMSDATPWLGWGGVGEWDVNVP